MVLSKNRHQDKGLHTGGLFEEVIPQKQRTRKNEIRKERKPSQECIVELITSLGNKHKAATEYLRS